MMENAPMMDPGKEQANQDSCTGVATAFTIVSIIIVALRLYTRQFIVRNLGKDDLMMLTALVFTIGYLAAIYLLRENGMGFSGATLSLVQMENLIQVTLGIEIMYYILIFSIKVSILFFYLRIAAQKTFERAVKGTIYLLTVFVIVCVVCCLVQCVPLHKMWDFTGMVPGHCINTTALFYFTSSFNIITDIWIIILPIKTLMKINRPRREKLALVGVFGLGIFSCIASIVRLHSIRIYTESKDPFYDSVPINLWSMIEVNIGIWCASIPSLKALISRAQRERSRTTANGGYKYHSRDKSGAKAASKPVNGSSTDGSMGTVIAPEVYGLDRLGQPLEHPNPVQLRKDSVPESERNGSQERIYWPGNEDKV